MWGQSAAAIERAYDIVAEAWTRIDDNGDAFQQGMSGVLDSWVGSVEVGCARHLGDFGDFVAGQRDAMSQLLQEFAHYAVVLSSARKDIVKAMRALVDACVQLGNNEDATDTSFLTTLFTAVAAAVLMVTIGGGGSAAVGAFGGLVLSAASRRVKNITQTATSMSP